MRFVRIQEAYRVLRNPESRRAYDAQFGGAWYACHSIPGGLAGVVVP